MADMDDFLGKVVVDSINDANKFSTQMDGLKLIGQRQVNIAQQEQISNDRRYIRQLEDEIRSLKSKLNASEKKANAADSGPSNGWARIQHWDGVYYRDQSMEGYKKEVKRLQSDILSLNFSLIFKEINLGENLNHIDLLSKYMDVPKELIHSTRRIGVVKYLYENKNKDFLNQIAQRENYQVGFFVNKKSDMFDLINFNQWYTNFFAGWIGDTYTQEEHNILKYLRENPHNIDKVKSLLGNTVNHLGELDLSIPYQPSLQELKLFIRIQTIVEGSRAALERYQGYIQMSNEEVENLYLQAKQDILNNNLTEREMNIYEIGLNEETRNNLKSGNLKLWDLPQNINTLEDLKKFLYNTDILKLEHRANKKVLAFLAIKERELNPLTQKEEESYERWYRDNDVGREAIESLSNLASTLTTLNNEGKFNYSFMRSAPLLVYCAHNQFINDEKEVERKREQEKRTIILNIKQKEYDEGLELLKCWLKHKDEILPLMEKLDFSSDNGRIKLPSHLIEPIKFIIDSKANIPQEGDTLAGLKISDDPAHKLSYGEITQKINFYIESLKSIFYQFKVSLVASENINIGGFFSKKYAKDVYLRFEFDIHSDEFIKGNKYRRFEEKIEPVFVIDGKTVKFYINNRSDSSGYFRTPNVIYYKIGQFPIDDEIKEINMIINQTPNESFAQPSSYYPTKPFNTAFVFNKKVSELAEAPPHAKICSEKIANQLRPDWKQLDHSLFVFTEQELDKFSEGKRKKV